MSHINIFLLINLRYTTITLFVSLYYSKPYHKKSNMTALVPLGMHALHA
jgi:hypothetical protein